MTKTITPSSGDIFQDLGFSAVEAGDLRLRSELLSNLIDRIQAIGKSQKIIAQLLGITQPRVSNLLHGRLDLFSLDTLVELLGRLGQTVDVTVRAAKVERRPIVDATESIWGQVDTVEDVYRGAWHEATVLAPLTPAIPTAHRIQCVDRQYDLAA